MAYREVLLRVPQAEVEALSDALLEAGALSVLVEDADRDSPDEQPLFGEPGLEPAIAGWVQSELIILLPAECQSEPVLQAAFSALGMTPIAAHTERWVAEQDWVRLTQSQFEPIPISSRLWIVPTWHTAPPDDDRVVLRLDPGLAFGTGSHPTTRLCLQWLEQHVPNLAAPTVLDYGCGSGILAIAAKKLGAGLTLGVDIDPQAVTAAQANAVLNEVEATFSLPDAPLPQAQATQGFAVVVANILSNPLKILAPMLVRQVAPGGYLVLSGVLARQAEEVAAAYAPYLNVTIWQSAEGWVCLAGQKQ
ncbi:50S ribosomal protein L11 methyltransferase [Parvibium lacunae]|uniref:Ribosomal protein L11 methyltransferase n=1 Tax=Parvibium lacunae TaxID=1888893 RepID=A0A368L200_9BURK|nr:50S ribosomal protein L11 methyltransferase [Parvibium lacunae]RCS57579.1 50S ribosomal protein L11 methyltransferase [Parvibium lacunae]